MTDALHATKVEVSALEPREIARVCGRIVAIQVEPADAPPALVARIDDGTGRVDAVFMGRREVPGIEPGRQISIEGRVCDGEARLTMFNPRYELACQP